LVVKVILLFYWNLTNAKESSKMHPKDNEANMGNANLGMSGTNPQYDQVHGNRSKQLEEAKKKYAGQDVHTSESRMKLMGMTPLGESEKVARVDGGYFVRKLELNFGRHSDWVPAFWDSKSSTWTSATFIASSDDELVVGMRFD
jgi:hypothetical protein